MNSFTKAVARKDPSLIRSGAAASLALLRELLTTHQQWTSVLLDSEHEVGSVLIRIITLLL